MPRLLAISRPRFWLYVLGPALIGVAANANPLELLTHASTWLILLSWTLPANLFLYGINDLCDSDTDTHNEKKNEYEVRVQKHQHDILRTSVLLSASVVSIAALVSGSLPTMVWTGLFLILGAVYSAPPLRLKSRAFVDSFSNVLYILPGCAIAGLSHQSIPLVVFLGGWSWSAAMHLFSAIPDIEPDTKAKLHTTAIACGHTGALALTGTLWSIAALCSWLIPELSLAPWLALIYPIIGFGLTTQPSGHVFRVYRLMPLFNALVGFVLFWDIRL